MPTREEKVAQIEAALKQRFFALVPKIEKADRANWTEDQHDIDRLSRALAAYSIVGRCGVDDAAAVGTITDGSNDGGIDALYFHRAESRLLIIQSKFKRAGTAPSQDEVLKTINGVRTLLSRRFDNFNDAIRNRLDEIEAALDTPGTLIEVVLVYLGDNLAVHATNDLDGLKAELNRLNDRLDWTSAGLDPIYQWLVTEQSPITVDARVTLENWHGVTRPRKAVYGQIKASALAALVTTHGKALFERNIRHYLGSVGVNTAIEESVRRRPTDFFYLNNGITAVADSITQAGGTNERCAFGLKNLSIVNGAQTAGAIANASFAGDISDEARLLITVIEVGDDADSIGMKVTRARNHQNVVRGVDFAALDPNQERIRQELAMAGITYHYRPSAEARARRHDAFTLEEAAVALACLSQPVLSAAQAHRPSNARGVRAANTVDFVVTAKKEVGRLWEQDGAIYTQLFPATLSGVRISRAVRIYRFVDKILADTESSERTYERRMFFRHGRYFLMAFLAYRLPNVIARAELALSEADRTLLSQQTNELAELILGESRRLVTDRGYLSIFRNLMDAQPLADRVLDRLSLAVMPAVPQAVANAPDQRAPREDAQ